MQEPTNGQHWYVRLHTIINALLMNLGLSMFKLSWAWDN
jgi:hypothetical protein